MCQNAKCRVKALELGRCARCGEIACMSCGFRTLGGVRHDGAFCHTEGIFHETSVESELRP